MKLIPCAHIIHLPWWSLPPRGAWIEMSIQSDHPGAEIKSLPPRGAWIEICPWRYPSANSRRRSPRGERGLKCFRRTISRTAAGSLPPRGAWIEIHLVPENNSNTTASLPPRGAWIEIKLRLSGAHIHRRRSPRGERGLKSAPGEPKTIVNMSLPPRGAWIEIAIVTFLGTCGEMSLPPRGAWIEMTPKHWSCAVWQVAPPAGSVD